ncbi:MAG: ATP-binding protein [Cellvibrionaceae bacterium]
MMTESNPPKNNKVDRIHPYDMITTIASRLSNKVTRKKINKALDYIKKTLNLEYIGVYLQEFNHDKLNTSELEFSSFPEKTINLKKSNIYLIPSTHESKGLIIETSNIENYSLKDSLEFQSIPNNKKLEIQALNKFWGNDLSDIIINTINEYRENIKIEKNLEQLNRTLNTSDSIYASWNHKVGWSYHNVKSIVEMGYKKESINIKEAHKNNPIHEEDWKDFLPLFDKCVKQGIGYQYDYRTIGSKGKTHWYHNYVKVTEKNPDGSARQFTAISENITDIKKSEELLIASSEREKWLVNLANDMFNCNDSQSIKKILIKLAKYLEAERCVVRIVDPETLYCNLIAEYSSPELQPIAELFPDIISQTGIGWVSRLIQLGKAYIVEDYSTEVPNKKLVDYHKAIGIKGQVCHPLIHNNELLGYMAVMTSHARKWKRQEIRVIQVIAETLYMAVTRNRLLNELSANDARYEITMKSSSHGIWDYNLETKALFISPHYFKKLGYELSEVEPSVKFIESITHPDDKNLLSKESLKYYGTRTTTIEVEVRQRKKTGDYVWILSRGKVVKRDKKGRPIRITGINTEIEKQKNTLKKLEKIREISVAENKSKSEFLERMSHEIRTPMNAITGMAYLTADTELSEEQRNYIDDIDSAAQSLLRIIDDILDFSKIESGELTIVNQPFSLKDELARAEKLISLKASQRNNTLEVKISDDVPQYVVGDSNRLGQVLLNLLSNAAKFTSNGSISLSAQIAETNEKLNTTSVLFSVSDSGIGLEKQQIKTLFDPFVQAKESTTRHFGGTGLGLSICKNLVEMMGGSIHVISLPDIGTTFHFTINFGTIIQSNTETKNSAQSAEENLLTSSAQDSFTLNNTFDGKTILLVEDNIVNQKVAKGILTKFGLETIEANNGQEAIDLLEKNDAHTFDAILMDIEMPVLNGISASKAIRTQSKWNHLPIIAMTAHAMVGDKERCLDAGMNDYIPKPITPNQLIQTLAKYIVNDSSRQQTFNANGQ